MNFDPDKTVTANAVKALQDYIIRRALKPGDSLPTKAEFCELFGVNRGIIREALQYFRALGIIQSCRGEGKAPDDNRSFEKFRRGTAT